MLLTATYSNAGFLMPLVLIGSDHPYLLIFMPLIWMFHVKRFRENVVKKMKMEVFTEDANIHAGKLVLATKTFGFYLSHSILPLKTTFYHSLLESIAGSRKKHAYTFCRFFWIGFVLSTVPVVCFCPEQVSFSGHLGEGSAEVCGKTASAPMSLLTTQ